MYRYQLGCKKVSGNNGIENGMSPSQARVRVFDQFAPFFAKPSLNRIARSLNALVFELTIFGQPVISCWP
jgi:hypothetical protein